MLTGIPLLEVEPTCQLGHVANVVEAEKRSSCLENQARYSRGYY